MQLKAAIPVIYYSYRLLLGHRETLSGYFFKICWRIHLSDPLRLMMSLLLVPISGIEYLQHYGECYQELQELYEGQIPLYGRSKLVETLESLDNSMLAWKLLLFQRQLLKEHPSRLLDTQTSKVLDIDGSSLKSFSSKKEGSEIGLNRKYRGKPCFQLSASFIGRIFIDGRLFPGHHNTKDFFRKAVKRARSLGYSIEMVRADSAYFTAENLRFLQELSLGYAIGVSSTFNVVKEGKARFKKLARKKHRSIVALSKGVTAMDLGEVFIENLATRIIIIRRIQRRKNKTTGKWKIKTYFYAIATSLTDSVIKVVKFYHQRQCIEAGFRELKDHYALERLPVKNLKGNEFWIICKMIAMTLVKLFQEDLLPKAKQRLLRATLLRTLFQNKLRFYDGKKVVIRSKTTKQWILQRMIAKLERMEISFKALNV